MNNYISLLRWLAYNCWEMKVKTGKYIIKDRIKNREQISRIETNEEKVWGDSGNSLGGKCDQERSS